MAAVLLLSALCASGQQNSPLQGQGKTPDGVTNVYFSAYLERLLKVDDIEYQVCGSNSQRVCKLISNQPSLPLVAGGLIMSDLLS